MAKSLLEIIISIIKQGQGDKQAKDGIEGLNKAFKDLTGVSLPAVTALAAVGLGLRELIKFTKQSITETVAYTSKSGR